MCFECGARESELASYRKMGIRVESMVQEIATFEPEPFYGVTTWTMTPAEREASIRQNARSESLIKGDIRSLIEQQMKGAA